MDHAPQQKIVYKQLRYYGYIIVFVFIGCFCHAGNAACCYRIQPEYNGALLGF